MIKFLESAFGHNLWQGIDDIQNLQNNEHRPHHAKGSNKSWDYFQYESGIDLDIGRIVGVIKHLDFCAFASFGTGSYAKLLRYPFLFVGKKANHGIVHAAVVVCLKIIFKMTASAFFPFFSK